MAKKKAAKTTRAAGPRRARKQTARQRTARSQTTRKSSSAAPAARAQGGRKAAARKSGTGRKPARPKAKAASSPLASAAEALGSALGSTVAAVTSRLPGRKGGTDAIDILERDHRRLEELLAQGEETTARATRRRQQLLETIARELRVHELIEERILYPTLESHPEAKDIVLEGYEEHHVADVVLAELDGVSPSDERWGAKFKVFKENIEHHIEEEEGEMFRKARSVLSRDQRQAIGAKMLAMKQDAGRRQA